MNEVVCSLDFFTDYLDLEFLLVCNFKKDDLKITILKCVI
jgi:hypothetical protein